MMMSFCRKSLHSFLGFTTTTTTAATESFPSSITSPKSPWKSHHTNNDGLGLKTAVVSDYTMQKFPNVLESSSVNKPASSPLPKKDPGGIGFIDDVGGVVDGLMLCTESLGFESSDERLVNDINQMDQEITMDDYGGDHWRVKSARRKRVVVKKFPPPLSSLNQHGHPKFYLRPVRKDGKLELTEIRIDRPEILRACREDGRLRLHFIMDEQDKDEDLEEEEEGGEVISEGLEEEEEERVDNNLVKEKEENRLKNPVSEEGFRRCIEAVSHHHRLHHHNHHLDAWRQQCVTIS